jgi:hypothetical protein
MAEAKNTAGKDLAKKGPSSDQLAELSSFDDALKLARELYGDAAVVAAADVIGDGFKLLDNKDQLIEVPFLAISWDFHQGTHGEFVSVKVMTKDGQKFVLNDGSTGIRDQLMSYTANSGNYGGLFCMKGLRRSDYTYKDEKGNESQASTYYLDTSA